ncbi:hypothetical protein DFA_01856 [Cavenderia fasciculata]|uniref:RRM domain-containing protein n=1 Tax=Cavenderia fasciculata TaxID=261658 RepID=F4PV62_CACFS|nr:uncharacterized protein DFA_01856 [Cavenderia fasciculata]EGG21970.1 hypothetical protein DFA_01856 [Cavenderia fasciculata]|eukprot:XP_004359821.1 hypothetical protein DFA_01856 [Cavenderia fasciculata]
MGSATSEDFTEVDECNVFVKYLPCEYTEKDLFNLFLPHGSIINTKVMVNTKTGSSLGYGFVRFSEPSNAKDAVAKMNRLQIGYKTLLCKLSKPSQAPVINPSNMVEDTEPRDPSASIYVRVLSPTITDAQLRAAFEPFGDVIESQVLIDQASGKSKRSGYVRFANITESTNAITVMNGSYHLGGAPLIVRYSSSSKSTKQAQQAQQAQQAVQQQQQAVQQQQQLQLQYYQQQKHYSSSQPLIIQQHERQTSQVVPPSPKHSPPQQRQYILDHHHHHHGGASSAAAQQAQQQQQQQQQQTQLVYEPNHNQSQPTYAYIYAADHQGYYPGDHLTYAAPLGYHHPHHPHTIHQYIPVSASAAYHTSYDYGSSSPSPPGSPTHYPNGATYSTAPPTYYIYSTAAPPTTYYTSANNNTNNTNNNHVNLNSSTNLLNNQHINVSSSSSSISSSSSTPSSPPSPSINYAAFIAYPSRSVSPNQPTDFGIKNTLICTYRYDIEFSELYETFSRFGSLKSLKINNNKLNKLKCFITFINVENAVNAQMILDRSRIGNQNIRVKFQSDTLPQSHSTTF